MKVALDSNLLIYLAGLTRGSADSSKADRLAEIVPPLSMCAEIVIPAQVLGEVFTVLNRTGTPAEIARTTVQYWASAYPVLPSTGELVEAAMELVVRHKLQFWDALILSAAAEAGCALLLSEDMQDGFVSRGVTVVNPLAERVHPRLAALLAEG